MENKMPFALLWKQPRFKQSPRATCTFSKNHQTKEHLPSHGVGLHWASPGTSKTHFCGHIPFPDTSRENAVDATEGGASGNFFLNDSSTKHWLFLQIGRAANMWLVPLRGYISILISSGRRTLFLQVMWLRGAVLSLTLRDPNGRERTVRKFLLR